MSFQLLGLAIYNSHGDRRTIEFRPGALNVVTGVSLTGKSALISIIDYCLGRHEYDVIEKGIITDHVVWYATHCLLKDREAVLGRPAPPDGAASTGAAYLEVGTSLSLPDFTSLRQNTTADALVTFLDRELGIEPNETTQRPGRTTDPLRANSKHSRLFTYLSQDTVASKRVLFDRQGEERMEQTIKDVLPYFLGATNRRQLELLQQVRLLKRNLRRRQRRLEDEEAVTGREAGRAGALVTEAEACGLAPVGSAAGTFEEAVGMLRSLPVPSLSAPDRSRETLLQLDAQREEVLASLRTVQAEVQAAQAFAEAERQFHDEAGYQIDRLSAVNMFPDGPAGRRCPVCESEMEQATPAAEDLRLSLEDLERQIGQAGRRRPGLERYAADREEVAAALREQLRSIKEAADAVLSRRDSAQGNGERGRLFEQLTVVGRISLFLENVQVAEEDSPLRSEVERLEREIDDLERELSLEEIEDALEIKLRTLSRYIGETAESLV